MLMAIKTFFLPLLVTLGIASPEPTGHILDIRPKVERVLRVKLPDTPPLPIPRPFVWQGRFHLPPPDIQLWAAVG